MTEQGAWAELFRHQISEELSPFEMRRRVGRVRVNGLRVLDLTNPTVLAALGLGRELLVGDDLQPCQEVAKWAEREGYQGILAPSAALGGEVILAVFASAIGKLSEEHSRVQRPPRRMAPLVPRIRQK